MTINMFTTLDQETAAKMGKEMYERSRQQFEALKAKRGEATATVISEVANLVNIAQALAHTIGHPNPFTDEIVDSITRMHVGLLELTKMTEQELGDEIIAIARTRHHSVEKNPITTNES